MKAVVVLPTYNERENIKIIIPELQKVFKKIKYDMHILIVDDNSPDGTQKEVKKFQKKYKNIHLITGDKKGLGVAYLRGFDYAINELKADVLQMMDADLSHPPDLLPRFMKEIEKGNDIVIGSRYIKGGDTPDWGLMRKVISFGGNFFARIVAGLYKIHDCTSGYRAIRSSVYKKINKENLHTKGYAFMSTLLYELFSVGAKPKEIPLVFYDRKHGETKLRTKDLVEFFINAFRLRFRTSEKLIKFMIVGGSGIFVNIGLFKLFQLFYYGTFGQSNITLVASSLTGDELSIIYNFLLNHFWTFRDSTNDDHIFIKILKFHAIAITSVVINNLILLGLTNFFGMWDVFAKAIGIVVAFLWNYFMNTKHTWGEKIE